MLIFTDIETTGLEADDVMCGIALLSEDKVMYELLNEGKKIPPLASSIHHITNEMIQDKKLFIQSEVHDFLEQNNNPKNTLIAHNIKFDLEKLAAAGLHWQGDIIDTLKVTKHLIKECELFSLEFLRYELKLYMQENEIKQKYGIKDALCTDKALSDVLVTKLLFEYLLEYATVKEMKELSFQNVLLEKFTFGKYKGKYIEEIVLNDRSYIAWMLSLKELDEDLKYSLEYYMRG
ncbi:exonuclease domain-containing protein [Sulfurimonas autotrophica]|uniref:Exonuclease RNase T and DNA polymerase III n=1 Tax=Sulfurimonas autotrophica (strain ATCC BAA-671 / DSM 16294 / JCM 11897 / OK10) TaxID=563040 RepID=E0UV55_SULAO|nr:exonuclease domain-containing protein [Sulfurimonas autotrophica]ADN09637.1 Exonuclease RNase T and DNA polymerase III [Sulfurimonas autotrophica DSM 16294]